MLPPGVNDLTNKINQEKKFLIYLMRRMDA